MTKEKDKKKDKVKKGKDFDLNLKQSKFSELYSLEESFFANGVECYIEAYKPKRVGNWYNSAKASASRLLTNVNILKYINHLLELRGLNDAFVDKQLELLITQNADFKSKVAAIKEYNVLKKRVNKGLELPLDGEKVQVVGIVIKSPDDKDNKKDTGDKS